ncbi:TauD/TfdA family dioxygenase [Pedobacter sp. SYSU D00535]|uniref:TauD/TfdA family dioxygenase n=1 Tax=Pedobacter sp. SYSU D00535 TaxID=2810308 RepID=UPI001A95F9D9|nr:TauD/TfdA family dioxygenase [Pedobacter sp. SYSU D00535]
MIPYVNFNTQEQENEVLEVIRKHLSNDGAGSCIVKNRAVQAESFMLFLHLKLAQSFTFSRVGTEKVPFDLVSDRGADDHGTKGTIISATNQAFPLHTDCSYLDKPAEVVSLYCLENSCSGGESLLLNINDLIPTLNNDYLGFLKSQKFRVHSKEFPILEETDNHFSIRFSEHEIMESYKEDDYELVKRELEQFLRLLSSSPLVQKVKLEKNDCLLVNNRTCLHGRNAFEANSDRIFLRSRQYWRKS